jgi:hypothetical protein
MHSNPYQLCATQRPMGRVPFAASLIARGGVVKADIGRDRR